MFCHSQMSPCNAQYMYLVGYSIVVKYTIQTEFKKLLDPSGIDEVRNHFYETRYRNKFKLFSFFKIFRRKISHISRHCQVYEYYQNFTKMIVIKFVNQHLNSSMNQLQFLFDIHEVHLTRCSIYYVPLVQ